MSKDRAGLRPMTLNEMVLVLKTCARLTDPALEEADWEAILRSCFSPAALRRFPSLRVALGITVQQRAIIAASQARQTELFELAHRDALTGLLNRRSVGMSLGRAMSYGPDTATSLLMVDIDHFKAFNDKHGHSVGDEVLLGVTRIMLGVLRDGDALHRYGGEEFLVILPDTNIEAASVVAERLREAVALTGVLLTDGSALSVTVSVGVSSFLPGQDFLAAAGRADKSLYDAKEFGRNRVVREDDVPIMHELEIIPARSSRQWVLDAVKGCVRFLRKFPHWRW